MNAVTLAFVAGIFLALYILITVPAVFFLVSRLKAELILEKRLGYLILFWWWEYIKVGLNILRYSLLQRKEGF